MKSRFLALILILSIHLAFAGTWRPITSSQPEVAKAELMHSNISTSVIRFSVPGYFLNDVKTPSGDAYTISLGNSSQIMEKGSPDLPKLTASVIIPDAAQMKVEVLSSSFIEVPEMLIAPSKGNLTRDIDPSTVPFSFGNSYSLNRFFPSEQAYLRDPFILRDFRGQTVVVQPFAYNPVTRVLRIYTELVVSIEAIPATGSNILQRNSLPSHIDQEFAQVYNQFFLNSGSNNSLDYTPVEETGRMLIICHPNFLQAMQPFVDWKNSTGIRTEMVNVSSVGATASAIKTYVANYYNNNGLTFLMLIGDGPQIPTNSGGNLGGPSDNAYGYLVGNDHYPDIFVGRFSGETVDHINTMVQRTLEYEKNPATSTDWFSKGIGIGSDQGPGDDNEYDYQHIRNIRTQLLGFSYTAVAELYDGSQGGEDQPGNPSPSMVASFVNAGASIMNYTGHGSQTSWGTSGFSNSDVNNLTNNHMWPFIWSVACVNGDFVTGTCFAEAWTRAKNANGPTGAVATLMSTINQSWNPPMEGHDEMNAILTAQYSGNRKFTFGGLSMNGCCKMNDSYGSDGDAMTDTWTIFGDPSVKVRTALPDNLAVSHEPFVFIGFTSFQISTPTNGALAALSNDGQLITAGFVSGGTLTLNFPAFQAPDTLKLVVTAFNKLPYIVDIPVIPNNGPFLIYNSNRINDPLFNNNSRADYGETVAMSITFKNIGSVAAENVSVTVASSDPYISLTSNNAVCTFVPSNDTASTTYGFSFLIPDSMPDLHVISFQYSAVSGAETWTGSFNVVAHAGVLSFYNFSIDDSQGNGNGKIEPGETFNLIVTIRNSGTADATGVTGQLSFNDPWLTLVSSNIQSYGNVNYGFISQKSYTIQVSPDAPQGHLVPTAFYMTADRGLEGIGSFNLVVGQMPVAVIDLDGNLNSGPVIKNALIANNIYPEYKGSLPSDLSNYEALFVCLGTGNKKHVLTASEGQQLSNFLADGGRIYMEGGDTWYADPKTAVHSLFKVNGVMNGNGDLAVENGFSGSFAEGLSFSYSGDNQSIDHIAAISPAFLLFKNSSPLYVTGVALDAGTYRTVASSFEFGGITDGAFPSTRTEYMRRIIEFFGIAAIPMTANFMGSPVNICDNGSVTFMNFSAGNPTSFLWSFPGGEPSESTDPMPVVTYHNPGQFDVQLIISDGINADTLLRTGYIDVAYCTGTVRQPAELLKLVPNPASESTRIILAGIEGMVNIHVENLQGKVVSKHATIPGGSDFVLPVNHLPAGVYLVHITSATINQTRKLIVTR